MASKFSEQSLTRLRENKAAIDKLLNHYGASNLRLFGSVAEGTAGPDSDIDLLVELSVSEPGIPGRRGSILSRLAGLRSQLEELLQTPVDLAYPGLLKKEVSEAAQRQLVAL